MQRVPSILGSKIHSAELKGWPAMAGMGLILMNLLIALEMIYVFDTLFAGFSMETSIITSGTIIKDYNLGL